ASFGLLYVWHLAPALREAHTSGLETFWSDAFPPHSLPALPGWFLRTHAGRLYAYPIGEKRFASVIPLAFWICGVCWCWARPARRWLAALLILPQVLLLFASWWHVYPHGGHARVTLFLAPSM